MNFVDLDNIRLKEILTPYVLTVLKEKYVEAYQQECLDKIIEEYKKYKYTAISFMTHLRTISHLLPKYMNVWQLIHWRRDVADFPKRYTYSSGLNHPNGFKKLET